MTDTESTGPEVPPGGPGPDRLWAPWRYEYLVAPDPDECVLCTIPADSGHTDQEMLITARFELCYVLMNLYPYNPGHLMIVPYEHQSRLQELPAEVHTEMMQVAGLSVDVLTEAMSAQGFNIGFNLGRAGGAGIIDHLHLHVVPRWVGDTNFMPVLGETRVLSDDLWETCARLQPVFDRRRND